MSQWVKTKDNKTDVYFNLKNVLYLHVRPEGESKVVDLFFVTGSYKTVTDPKSVDAIIAEAERG